MAKKELTINGGLSEKLGKSYSQRLRESGYLPAVVYGPELKENLYISMNYNEFEIIFKLY